ncbi:MAG: Fe-S cluster assembly protein SufD [Actinomycetota bacterium]|nr:Fe-S cluster assembly protein SufD [Actinomycetota bacterium]
MSTFPLEAAVAAEAPDWLHRRRVEAAERFAATALPTTDDEVWRYSRIADLDLGRYRAVTDTPGEVPAAATALADRLGGLAGLIVVVDGHVVRAELRPELENKGVRFGRMTELDTDGSAFGAVLGEAPDAFGELAIALSADPVLLDVPDGVVVDEPFGIVQFTATAGGASSPRLVVRAGAASEVNLVEAQASEGVDALVLPVVELSVGRDARVGYVNHQNLGREVWQIGEQASSVGQQAHLVASVAAFGGAYARVRADCRLDGRGATADLLSIYYGDEDQTLDFRTFQDHVAPDCTSDLLFKGVVDDRSRSVYSGLIKVRPGARGTNAFQTNRNVKLSAEAWAESVPNLEIENNDVRCSHASTVGPIDADQRFYLESRGVPTDVAERLVVSGFLDEVVERLPVEAAKALVRNRIEETLDAAEGLA